MNCCILSIIAFYVQSLHAKNGVTSPTGAILTFPFGGGLPNMPPLRNMTVTPAEFGIHNYGGFVRGLVVIPAAPKYRTECPAAYQRNSTQEAIGLNGYLAAVNKFSVHGQEKWIMMIDRGTCFFVDKVKHAQDLGADAVIVVDSRVEPGLVIMWPPENFLQSSIIIPSVFISETDGKTIYEHLGVTGFDLRSATKSNLTYPAVDAYPRLTASIEWGLPHPDDHVEWELWTSSDDKLAPDFFPFGEISENLTVANDAFFTPHYNFLDGSHWGCTAPSLPCGTQCTNSGRYCSPDPEKDFQKGITGAHVIRENLRQICVFRYANNTLKNYLLWWQYVRNFHARCYDVPHYELSFNQTCSFQQMDIIDPSFHLKNYVKQCISRSGDYQINSGINYILRNESLLRDTSGVYVTPTVSINNFHIYGRMSCPLPIKTDTCQIFRAICAGFLEGTEPGICVANQVSCPGKYDCKGNCDGPYATDACRQCLPLNSTQWNHCVDCSGTPFGTKVLDCNGKCGMGKYQINRCGVCDDSTKPNWSTLGTDCTGQCGGNNQYDRCGVCLAPLDRKFDNCIGCDNVPYSNKSFDCARVCGGPHRIMNCPDGIALCVDTRIPSHQRACSGPNRQNATYAPVVGTTQQGVIVDTATKGNTTNIILIVLSILALLLVLVVLGIMYKNRQDTNERFNQLINQYQPLENDPQHSSTTKGQIDEGRRTLQEDDE